MTAARWAVIGLSVLLMAFDGFDVLAISFASPGIAGEWHLPFSGLGWVLSLELFGMAAGALCCGMLADRIGRRPTLLACLLLMSLGMVAAGRASSLGMLAAARIATGLGIGGVLVCANSIAAEFSNAASRTLCIALAGAGYPLGAALGGFAASALLAAGGWRAVFLVGAVLTLLAWPLAWWLIPESPGWSPRRARERVPQAQRPDGSWSIPLFWITVLVTLTYFLHVFSFYFLLKWIPRIMTISGASAPQAARILTWATLGGVGGGLALGLLAGRTRSYPVTVALLLGSTLSIIAFGLTARSGEGLVLASILGGFTGNGAILGIYALIANAFPMALRGTGTGIAIGIGRLGAVAAPVVAGYLLDAGLEVPVVATIMACGSLLSVAALWALSLLQRRQADAGRIEAHA